jgi:peptidoglycan/LPS O-acetylase OafA/YrhL
MPELTTVQSPHPPAVEKGEPGLPLPENKLFYPALDGLRAIAVLLVFTAHYFNLPPALYWGWTGVDMFFVLSGFLITGILFDSRDRPHRFRIFYIRRTLRIFPLYYAALLLPVLLYPVFHWKLNRALWLWPVYLGNYVRLFSPVDAAIHPHIYEGLESAVHFSMPVFYTFDHLWSLCVEEQFYLVWPLVVYMVGRRVWLRNFCIGVVAAMPFVRMICLHFVSAAVVNASFLSRTTPLRADSLLLGGAVALCLRGPEAKTIQRLAKPVAISLVILMGVLEIICRIRDGHFIDPLHAMANNPWCFTLLAFLSAAIILMALRPGNMVYRVCMNAKLRALGQRSYGFYVYHAMLYCLFQWIAIGLALGHRRFVVESRAIVGFFGSLAISWLSYRYFEKPFLQLKDRFAP